MVPQHGLDELLAGLLVAVVGQVGEGGIDGHEQRVVGLGAVQQLDDVVVLVDQLGEVGRVLALLDQLVDGVVGGVMVAVVAVVPMVSMVSVMSMIPMMSVVSMVSVAGPINKIKPVIYLLVESILDSGLELVLNRHGFVLQAAKELAGTLGDVIPESVHPVRRLKRKLLQRFSIRQDKCRSNRHIG